jgi:hypothetical protein
MRLAHWKESRAKLSLLSHISSIACAGGVMLTVAVLAAATLGVAVFATFALKMVAALVRGFRVFFTSNPVDIKEKFGTWAGKY